MRKFFIALVLLLLLLNIAARMFHGDKPTPQSVFKEQMDVCPMKYYCSPTYGYNIAYPCFFHKEEDKTETNANDAYCHARFLFNYNTTITVETYVMPAPCRSTRACCLALADSFSSRQLIPPHGKNKEASPATDNSFILSGRVYENGQPTNGYSHYTKYIKSGRILFVYSLIYPEDYKSSLRRMFRTIDNWTVPGT